MAARYRIEPEKSVMGGGLEHAYQGPGGARIRVPPHNLNGEMYLLCFKRRNRSERKWQQQVATAPYLLGNGSALASGIFLYTLLIVETTTTTSKCISIYFFYSVGAHVVRVLIGGGGGGRI